MESTSRLYQCLFCHEQAVVCSKCDRGQIYCSRACSRLARTNALKCARSRYQSTFKGKRNHAACQARYRKNLRIKVMDQSSPLATHHDSIGVLENNPKKAEKEQIKTPLTCCFCGKPVSNWHRHDFLRRRTPKKPARLRGYSQAP